MKKRNLLIFFLAHAIVLATVSCDSEEILNPTNMKVAFSMPEAVLKEVQVSQIVANGEVYDFSYDSNGKLKEVSSFFQSEEKQDGTSYKVEAEYTLMYTGDRLSEVNKEFSYTRNLADGSQEVETGRTEVVYVYNENGLVEEVQKTFFTTLPDNIITESPFSHKYGYNQENKVVKITDFARGEKSDIFTILEWSGGNLLKQSMFYETGGKERVEEEATFSDYDDKNNPLMIFAVLFGNSQGITRTENNAGKIVVNQADENGSLLEKQVTTTTLTYDNKGRPIRYQTSTRVHELDEMYEEEYTVTYRD